MVNQVDAHPTVESWSEKDQKIIVKTPPGLMADLIMHGKVDASPSLIWDILTHPEPQKIFRGVKDVTYRDIVEDDGKGRRVLKVGHRSYVKFLWIQVTFDTDLVVEEDRPAGVIHFRNASETFMKFFDGTWTVQPFTQKTLDQVFGPEAGEQLAAPETQKNWLENPGNLLSRLTTRFTQEGEPESCLVTLEQQILPKAIPPPGIRQLVTRMCAGTLRTMMEDLRREAARCRAGDPTLPSATPVAGSNNKVVGTASITSAALEQPFALERLITPIDIFFKV